MSGHADTIRRYITAPLPDFEDDSLEALDALVAELQQQADRIAWLEGDVAGWRIKLAECEAEKQQLREALRRRPSLL